MNQLLRLLRQTRDARKEAAQAKLAVAQTRLADALAAARAANQQLLQAQAGRDELLQRNGAGLPKDWRHTTLPSSQALVFVHAKALNDAARRIEEEKRAVQEARSALTLCEKALLRTDELQGILKHQRHESLRLAEQSEDDDLAIAHGGLASVAAGLSNHTTQSWK